MAPRASSAVRCASVIPVNPVMSTRSYMRSARIVRRQPAVFTSDSLYRSKAEVLRLLTRVGLRTETVADIHTKLPDPVDIDEAAAILLLENGKVHEKFVLDAE